MRKIPGGIASWALAAIHVHRPADNQPANGFGITQGKHRVSIGGEFLPPEDFQRAGHDERSIGNSKADGFLANVQSQQPPAAGKRRRHIVKLADRHTQ